MNPFLQKIKIRSEDFISSSEYRGVLFQRFIVWLIQLLNSKVTYIGVSNKDHDIILFTNDVGVTPLTLSEGEFQRRDLIDSCRILEKNNIVFDNGIFLDVGGNIGTTSVYASLTGKFSSVICFEPEPNNIRMIKANVAINSLEEKIKIVPAAVSDKPGELTLKLSENNFGDHQMLTHKNTDSEKCIQVPVICLDDYLSQNNLSEKVKYIWCDTQGFEGFVLKGAENFLDQYQVPLFFEFWPTQMQQNGCLEDFLSVISKNYTHFFDFHKSRNKMQSISELNELTNKYLIDGKNKEAVTDLFFIRISP